MLSFLTFIMGAQWWSNLISSVLQSVPHVLNIISSVFVTLWSLLTWYIRKLYQATVQTWLTPVVLALIPIYLACGAGLAYHYAKPMVIAELRQEYRFVPKAKPKSITRRVKEWTGISF